MNKTKSHKYKIYTFILLTINRIISNSDLGVVPVMLNWIQEPYNFTESELGLMGCLRYVGLTSVSPFMSYIFLRYSSKKLIIVAMIMHSISLCIFGLAVNKYMFFISKFCVGAFDATIVIFCPIWVDTFAPESNRNLWLSIIQTGIICGGTLGYILTSLYSYAGEWSWRYSIFTQITFELVLTVLFYLIPKEFINFDPSRDENINFDLCTCDKSKNISINDESPTKSNESLSKTDYESVNDINTIKRSYTLDCIVSKVSSLGLNSCEKISKIYSNFEHTMLKSPEYSKCSKCFLNNIKLHQEILNTKNLSAWSKFKLLIKEKVFILSCLSISSLFFEVTGMHYWMTKIGISYYNIKEKTVHLILSLEAISGPILGIISGSYLIDQIIYHYPNNPLFVDYALFTYYAISTLTGLILITFQNPMTFAICIYIILFYGAALVPTITLMSVAYLPHRLKPAGASFFMSQYHILGFTLGTLIPGVAVDIFHNYIAGLYIIYLSGFVGLFLFTIIFYIKWDRIRIAKRTGRKIYIKGPVVILKSE